MPPARYYECALLHYHAAVLIHPYDAEALLNRAIAFDMLGKRELMR